MESRTVSSGKVKYEITQHDPKSAGAGVADTLFEVTVTREGKPLPREMVWLCLVGHGERRFVQCATGDDGKIELSLILPISLGTITAVLKSGSGLNTNFPLDFTSLAVSKPTAAPHAAIPAGAPITINYNFGPSPGASAPASEPKAADAGKDASAGKDSGKGKPSKGAEKSSGAPAPPPSAAKTTAAPPSNGGNRSTPPEEDEWYEPVVSEIQVYTTSTQVARNSRQPRRLRVRVFDQKKKPMNNVSVIWESADEQIGRVDQCGNFRPVAVGKTMVFAMHEDSGVIGQIEMEVVIEAPSIASAIVVNGAIVTLYSLFIAYFSNGSAMKMVGLSPTAFICNPALYIAWVFLGIFAFLNWRMNCMSYAVYRRNIIIASCVMAGIVGIYALVYHSEARAATSTNTNRDIVYSPGRHTLPPLKAKQITGFWITFPNNRPGGNKGITSSHDYNYILHFDDGTSYRDGKNVVIPHKNRARFKIEAITDQPGIRLDVT